MHLVIFAGPNGSGKSSIVDYFLNTYKYRYICPDNYYSEIFFDFPPEEGYRRSMEAAENDRCVAVERGVPFAFETVFSRPDKLDFIEYAKANNYSVTLIFVSTENPDINVERVKRRVGQGGHDVPVDKIYERYSRSMELLPIALDYVDEAMIFDNSYEDKRPTMILNKVGDEYFFLNSECRPSWGNYLMQHLSSIGKTVFDLSINETIEYFEI